MAKVAWKNDKGNKNRSSLYSNIQVNPMIKHLTAI